MCFEFFVVIMRASLKYSRRRARASRIKNPIYANRLQMGSKFKSKFSRTQANFVADRQIINSFDHGQTRLLILVGFPDVTKLLTFNLTQDIFYLVHGFVGSDFDHVDIAGIIFGIGHATDGLNPPAIFFNAAD